MAKIAIFGASGKSGLHLVAQALNKGHEVKAIVRNEEKLRKSLESDHNIKDNVKLEVCQVDNIFDDAKIKDHLVDVSCVMSTLGFDRGSTGYTDFTSSLIKSLKSIENGCRRCIFMHSWYTEPSSRSNAPFFLRWTLLKFIGPVLDNMRGAEKILEESDLDYTVVLPAGLLDGPASDKEFAFEEDNFYVNGLTARILRADVARYMIKTLEDDLHHKKIVAMGTK